MRRLTAVIAVALLLAACSGEKKNQKPLNQPGEKLYTLKGKVLGRDTKDNTINVDHEEIPGFMDAMTMDYSVRGAKVADLPPNGTKIRAKLHVTDDGYWLTDVSKAP
ncbi:MAG TPA: copper-binding protein [Thermoanaerobaculia bacterium]